MGALLKWALVCAVIAIIAGILGFGNVAEGFGDISRFLFFIFLAGVIILVVLALGVYTKIFG